MHLGLEVREAGLRIRELMRAVLLLRFHARNLLVSRAHLLGIERSKIRIKASIQKNSGTPTDTLDCYN